MVLVTGGTGLVGSHLLFTLTKAGISVRATYRNKESIKSVATIFSYYSPDYKVLLNKIEWVNCDINDIAALQEAFKNITQVYHCAALISFDPKNLKKLFKTNVEGTANIINLSIENKIEKLCHVSTIGTIGNTLDGSSSNEETPFNSALANVYALSKYQAEMEVWRGSQEGLNIVMVNPGVILGPGFWNNGSGKFFKNTFNGMTFYPPLGTGFVGINDVVKCMIHLMNSSINNENYILVAKNSSYKEVLTSIASALQKKPPRYMLKKWMLEILRRLEWLKAIVTGSERLLSKKMIDIEKTIASSASIYLKENL